jgi:NADH:ubiquinone oxidoreductase subunit E
MIDSNSIGKRDSLLAMISEEQRNCGFVSEESIVSMAQTMNISVSEVYGVATFYAFLSAEPQGKHVVRVCKSVPCHLKEAEMVASWIGSQLGITPGQTRWSIALGPAIGLRLC